MQLKLDKSNLKKLLINEFALCRQQTLAILADIDEEIFKIQAHPDFSPIGWHFGHIAYTESLWLLSPSVHRESLFPENTRLYAADGLPKSERINLPNIGQTRNLLDFVRNQVLENLQVKGIEQQQRLLHFLLQHESQHGETILLLLKLLQRRHHPNPISIKNSRQTPINRDEMVEVPTGKFRIGWNNVRSLDNEMGEHEVYLDTYYLDRYPVTRGQYRQFIQAGGYYQREFWTDRGWEWLQAESISQPLYWCDNIAFDNHPVCGVSWYEAAAYAKYIGKRLPTEAEWEKAARWDEATQTSRIYPWGEATPSSKYCNLNMAGIENQSEAEAYIYSTSPVNAHPAGKSPYGVCDTLGNVWEWTTSKFAAYPQFQPYPYIGYSQVYFDNQHYVLKGGSFATRQWSLRTSFRNWYHPSTRQIFSGFRCAL